MSNPQQNRIVPRIWDQQLFKKRKTSIATIRTCKWCDYTTLVPVGSRPGYRGFGMVMGNKARGEMIAHVKKCHPEHYVALRSELF